jgi:hypothetical protein
MAAERGQLGMCALLDDAAIVEDDEAIHGGDRQEAVGDRDDHAVLH